MQTQVYAHHDLPDFVHWQILSGLRYEWSFTFQGKNRGRRWISRAEFNPTHFVLLDNDFVVGYADYVSGCSFRESITLNKKSWKSSLSNLLPPVANITAEGAITYST